MPSMAGMRLSLLLCFSLAAVMDVAVAQTSSSGCSNIVLTLSPCLTYVTGVVAEPSQVCCSALANVVKVNATCLCLLFTDIPNVTQFNRTKAFAIPAACNVTAPPLRECKDYGIAIPPFNLPPVPPILPPVPHIFPPPPTGSGSGANSTVGGSKSPEVSSAGSFSPTTLSLFFMRLIFWAILL